MSPQGFALSALSFSLALSTRAHRRWDDPHASLSVAIVKAEDGVTVTVGEQQVWGIAADLVQTGIGALLNPMALVGEIDDIVRNVSKLNLVGKCPSCGGSLADVQPVTCPQCGQILEHDAKFCTCCGTRIAQ